jgi:hypothetical protein
MVTATRTPQLLYPSALKKRILKSLAEYYCLSVKNLVGLIYPEPNETHKASLRRCLGTLERDRLVNRISYRPDDYAGIGTLPLACGLSDRGVLWALDTCAWTDPKELIPDHSPLTIEHEMKRAQFHIKVVKRCREQRLDLYWKKTDLNHTVNPDDVFAIRGAAGIRYCFLELENKRKSFKELLAKYRRYDDYYDNYPGQHHNNHYDPGFYDYDDHYSCQYNFDYYGSGNNYNDFDYSC